MNPRKRPSSLRQFRSFPLLQQIPLRFFFFISTPTTEIYTLSLHDALPIFALGNLGDLSQKGFNKFGDVIDHTFDKLVKGGLSEKEALAAIAPQLNQLVQLQQQWGFHVEDRKSTRLNSSH